MAHVEMTADPSEASEAATEENLARRDARQPEGAASSRGGGMPSP